MSPTTTEQLRAAVLDAAVALAGEGTSLRQEIALERPPRAELGDYSTNAALLLAPGLGRPPREVAQELGAELGQRLGEGLERFEVAGPGFLNLFLHPRWFAAALRGVLDAGVCFGAGGAPESERILVEFVSANPTGPMHVGHARNAAYGDALARVLALHGHDVTREFYVNDAGSQVRKLGESIQALARGEEVAEDGYRGDYVKHLVTQLSDAAQADSSDLGHRAVEVMVGEIQTSLGGFGVETFDHWVYESTLHASTSGDGAPGEGTSSPGESPSSLGESPSSPGESPSSPGESPSSLGESPSSPGEGTSSLGESPSSPGEGTSSPGEGTSSPGEGTSSEGTPTSVRPSAVEHTLAILEQQGHTYRSEGALWLRTTAYGDDKDRVLVRSSGEHTYFASDIAYHQDKRERGFERQIDVWGADHHGYVARMKAAYEALGGDPEHLEMLIMQLVHLMRRGERAQMSKRAGEFVTLDDLVAEIGVDAARWFLLSRSHDTTIDLDLDLAVEQSSENPVYYVQYAHARIASMLDKAGAERVAAALGEQGRGGAGAGIAGSGAVGTGGAGAGSAALPEHASERGLIKRLLAFPGEVQEAARRRAPHRVAAYALELAQEFTAFYRDCHVLDVEPRELESARIALCVATQGTIARSLDLLGVSAPREM